MNIPGVNDCWYGGIDPGKHGAACLKCGDKIEIYDYQDLFHATYRLRQWKEKYNIAGFYLELVHDMPLDGKTSAGKLMRNRGVWEGALAALEIPFKLIPTQTWRKGLFRGIPGKTTKDKSLALARKMYPDSSYFCRKQDHDRAEAMLIAHQCERFWR